MDSSSDMHILVAKFLCIDPLVAGDDFQWYSSVSDFQLRLCSLLPKSSDSFVSPLLLGRRNSLKLAPEVSFAHWGTSSQQATIHHHPLTRRRGPLLFGVVHFKRHTSTFDTKVLSLQESCLVYVFARLHYVTMYPENIFWGFLSSQFPVDFPWPIIEFYLIEQDYPWITPKTSIFHGIFPSQTSTICGYPHWNLHDSCMCLPAFLGYPELSSIF